MTGLIRAEESHQIGAYANLTDTLNACKELGQALKTTFNLTSPHHGEIMMLTCLSEDISVSDYHKRYHGDGAMRASAIQAVFMQRGGVIEWGDLGDDGKVASAKFSHPVLMKNPTLIKYTIQDAARQVGDKMKKPGSNWLTNPGAMLRAALIRKAIKIIDPGVITGYDAFNDLDTDPIRDTTAVVISAEDAEARKAELLAGMNAPAVPAEEIIEAEYTAPVTEAAAEPEPQTQATEEPPFEMETPAVDEAAAELSPAAESCTVDQLQKLAEIGVRIPVEDGGNQLMSLSDVMTKIKEMAAVEQPKDMTHEQASNLIERWEAFLSQLPSS
jgi:hypothetical protein